MAVKATIYLSKGVHFFFTCSADIDSKYIGSTTECLYNYCEELDLYRYYSSTNDNYDITIMPLECGLLD
jgi:hypothetical protein